MTKTLARLLGCILLLWLPTIAWADPLDRQIRTLMDRTDVPGVIISQVKECRIASTRAWGVQSILSRAPMRPDNRIQAASIGKPVAAFAILQLARERPALDPHRPLGKSVVAYEVTPAAWAEKLTLAHLLSHQSSLANSPLPGTRKLSAIPGTTFRYSGLGFKLAQDIVEHENGRPLENIVRDRLFRPAGMNDSSYVDGTNAVTGHMLAGGLLINGAAPALAAAVLIGLIVLFWGRARQKVWRFGPGRVLLAGAGGTLGASALFAAFMGSAALPTVFILFGLLALVAWGAAILMARLWPKRGSALAGAIIAVAVTGFAIASVNVPIRTALGGHEGNIAYSLTSSAPDLARFAIEVMQPTSAVRRKAATDLITPVVDAGDGMQWGLGIGVRDTPQGRVNWQWAGNPGYSGLIVLRPQSCDAIIVLTNGEKGSEVARGAVQTLWGIDARWKV